MRLTPKSERFAREYLVDFNGAAAAIRAGYAERGAKVRACELLQDEGVQALIRDLQAPKLKKLEITAERTLEEMARIAYANMGDFIRIGKDGDPFIDLSACTPEQLAVLSETTVEDFTEGRGEDARDVRKVKIKLYSKLDALTTLMKHLGLLKDRLELTGANGGPLAFQHLSDDDLDRAISEGGKAPPAV